VISSFSSLAELMIGRGCTQGR